MMHLILPIPILTHQPAVGGGRVARSIASAGPSFCLRGMRVGSGRRRKSSWESIRLAESGEDMCAMLESERTEKGAA